MRLIIAILCLGGLTACGQPSSAAILVVSPNGGAPTVKATLSAAATDADAAGKTVMITSALSAVQSNISSATLHAWPSDRALKIEKGGSIANTTLFALARGVSFSAGNYHIFTGAGTVTGLTKSFPEWFGAKLDNSTDDTTALKAALASISPDGGELFINPSPGLRYTDTLTVNTYNVNIVGAGQSSSILRFDPATLTKGAIILNAGGCMVRNIQLTSDNGGGQVTGWGIWLKDGVSDIAIRDILMFEFQNGIKMQGWHCSLENSRMIYNGANAGIGVMLGDESNDSTTMLVKGTYILGRFSTCLQTKRAYGTVLISNIYEGIFGATTTGLDIDNSGQVTTISDWFEKNTIGIILGAESFVYNPRFAGSMDTPLDTSKVFDGGAVEAIFMQRSVIVHPPVTLTTTDKDKIINTNNAGVLRLKSMSAAEFNYPDNKTANLGTMLIKSSSSINAGEDEVFVNLLRTGGYSTYKRVLTSPIRQEWNWQPPTAGTWAVGDRINNTDPTSGGYIGWTCIIAGTPGTWKGFGAIQ